MCHSVTEVVLSPILHFVQATGVGLIVNLLHVCDGRALVSSRPYCACGVVCVGNSDAKPPDGEGLGGPLSQW